MREGQAKADRGECTQLTVCYHGSGQVGAASTRVSVERCGGVERGSGVVEKWAVEERMSVGNMVSEREQGERRKQREDDKEATTPITKQGRERSLE